MSSKNLRGHGQVGGMCYDTRGMFDAYGSSGIGLATLPVRQLTPLLPSGPECGPLSRKTPKVKRAGPSPILGVIHGQEVICR